MCLIVLALQAHPIYPLILVANRDEYHQRPTTTANFWHDQPDILAGRDLEAGGTWLGVNRFGKFSALTNVRHSKANTSNVTFTSRGNLCHQLLSNHQHSISEQLQAMPQSGHHYQPFNLIAGDINSLTPELYYYSNQQLPHARVRLAPGIHGLSNAALNTPWPKVTTSTRALQTIISKPFTTDDLLTLMQDTTAACDEALPDTGIPLEQEKLLSSRFIQSQDYGTRCTTAIIMNKTGELCLVEQSYNTHGQVSHRVSHQLNLAMPHL